MKNIKLNAGLVILHMMCANAGAAQVNILPNQSAASLSQRLTGQGITISNPVLTCSGNANGFFDVVTSNLGLDSGIILTTGRAATLGGNYGANGPQFAGVNNNASLNNTTPGDPQLDILANNTTRDACILEFDLVPKGDTIRFDYVFGSEEYWKSTCGSYNDAFAFFISGPGINGQDNMALVPGTNIPVTVNSINSGIPGTQGNIANCYAMGNGSPFTNFYVDNSVGTTITYYGFTTVLTAQHDVQPCSTYHLKLTIADAGNNLYDSGVFLKAGSLKTSSFNIHSFSGTSSNDTIVVKGCNPGQFIFTRSEARPAPQTIRFQIAGTAVNGTDYSFIPDSVVIPANDSIVSLSINGMPGAPVGERILKIYLYSPYSCSGLDIVDSAYLKILDPLSANILTPDTLLCAGSVLHIQVNGSSNLHYNWSPSVGLSSITVKEPQVNVQTDITYVMTAGLPGSGCAPIVDSLHIAAVPAPVITPGPSQLVCPGGTAQLTANVSPAGQNYSYLWQGPANFTAGVEDTSVNNVTSVNAGTYTISVAVAGCPPVNGQVQVLVDPPLDVNAGEDISVCPGDDMALTVSVSPSGQYNYQWSGPSGFSSNVATPQISNINHMHEGAYIVTASRPDCTPYSDTVQVIEHSIPDKPSLTGAGPLVYCQNDVPATLHVRGENILWYLNDSAIGTPDIPVSHTASVGMQYFYATQTVNGCVSPKTLVEVYVEKCCDVNVFVPSVFSPNGDGTNDVLRMVESPYLRMVFFNVFNRWGELVFKGNSTDRQWDGSYKGLPAEVGDYFYHLSAECKNGVVVERKGEVILVR